MKYTEIKPSGVLSYYVKCFWILESDSHLSNNNPERVIPDGCTELIFNYGDIVKKINNNGTITSQPRFIYVGQIKQFITIRVSGNIGIIVVRFLPNGSYPFLDLPMNELTGNTVEAETVLISCESKEISEKIINVSGASQKVEILSRFLEKKIIARHHYKNRVTEAIRLIDSCSGNILIEDLAYKCNTGCRNLERTFLKEVGITPKEYTRILKIQSIVKLVRSGRFLNFAEIAHLYRYYDQAHFIKDFKSIVGITPVSYFSEINPVASRFIS